MILDNLYKQKLIHPPKWLLSNCAYLTVMGSQAYGVSSDDSDLDVYGFCVPPKDLVFPHLAGEIPGFGQQIQRFDQWQEHKVQSIDIHDYCRKIGIETLSLSAVESEMKLRGIL